MSQRGSSRSSSPQRSRSQSPEEDRSFMNVGMSYALDDSFPRTPDGVHEYEPYDRREEFLVDEDEYNELMNERSIKRLKTWISHVYSKLSGYDYYSYELVEMIIKHEPDTFVTTSDRPSVILTGIKKVIRSLEDKFRQFDVGAHEISTLTGSKLGARIEAEAEKASKIFEEVEQENAIIRDSIKMAAFNIEELERKLNDALSYIEVLHQKDIFHAYPIKEKYFLEDLKYQREVKDKMESSLLDDLALMNKELAYHAKVRLDEHNENMRVLAEMEKDLQLEDGIRTALLSKIKTLESDEKVCEEALNEWMKAIKETVGVKTDEIGRMKDMVKSMDDEIEHLNQELNKFSRERQDLELKIMLHENAVQEKYKEIAEFDEEIKVMKEYIQELEQEYLTLSNEAESKKQDINSQSMMDRSYRSPSPSGSPGTMDRSGSSYAESMSSSKFRHSPKYVERASSPIYPPSPESPERRSPSSPRIPKVVITPPFSEYHADTDFRQDAPVDPSTQNMVSNRFDIGQNFNMHTVGSGTPSPYHQVTRLQTSQPAAGTSRMLDAPVHLQHTAEYTPTNFVTPYISTTRYGYTDPTAKCLNLPPGDDLDIGTSLKKTLLLTSPRREQPLLVNIDVQPQPLTETANGEQFICDISLNLQDTNTPPIEPTYTYGVPPAVTPTTARRHGQFTPRSIFKKRHYNIRRLFGPQYESPEMPSKWSPHYLPFDSRSPVTSFPPSPYYSDRSISWERSYDNTFDDSMMNRTYDPQSGTSAMNRTFEGPGTAAINRTFEGPGTSAMNRTFDRSPSPIIKPPLRRYPSPVFSDEPYDIDTSSPVIKGPSYRSPEYGRSPLSESPLSELDKTFDSSSPVIKGRFYRGSSPIHDSTFDRSQSSPGRNFDRSSTRHSFLDSRTPPGLDGSYGKSSTRGSFLDSRTSPELDDSNGRSSTRGSFLDSNASSGLDGSYGRSSTRGSFLDSRTSPGLDGSYGRSSTRGSFLDSRTASGLDDSYDKSFSPRSDKSFNQSLSPRRNGRFDRSFSPRSDKSFNQSSSPRRDGRFDRSFSPRSDKSFNQSLSPRRNVTFDESSSPRSDKSFNQSLSPKQDGTFDRSSSPRSDKSFNQSLSPKQDGTFDRSSSPRSDKSFNQSLSPRRNVTFDESSSPRSDKSFNQSLSPKQDGTFDRSSSPRSDKSFNQSLSPKQDGTFDRSSSPRSDKSFNQSLSPKQDGTFDRSFSSRSDKSFNQSLSPGPAGTFDSSSPRLDGTVERSPQQASNTTHGETNSSDPNGRFHNVTPQQSNASDRSNNRNIYLNVPNQESPNQNRTFDGTSSNQREDSGKST